MKLQSLTEKIDSYIRGFFFRVIYHIRGGKKLKIYPGAYFNANTSKKIFLGYGVKFYHDVEICVDGDNAEVHIGDRSYINRRSQIKCKKGVSIGADCAISWDVTITDTDYHSINGKDDSAEIDIGNHVWIGCKSTILKGVIIGDGAVIAAGSLVNRNVPAHVLVGGVPAKILKENVDWK